MPNQLIEQTDEAVFPHRSEPMTEGSTVVQPELNIKPYDFRLPELPKIDKPGIIDLAENHAFAQTELEILTPYVRITGLQDAAEAVISRYPTLEDYHDVFMGGVEYMKQSAANLDSFWSSMLSRYGAKEADTQTADHSLTALSDQLSHKLFTEIAADRFLDFNAPVGSVVAKRGEFTLIFEIDPEAWDKLAPRFPQILGQYFTYTVSERIPGSTDSVNIKVPVIFVRRKSDEPGTQSGMSPESVLSHEAEHARSTQFKIGYFRSVHEDRVLKEIGPEISKKAQDNQTRIIFDSFSEEFEAVVTQMLMQYDYRMAHNDQRLNHDTVHKFAEGLVRAISKGYLHGKEAEEMQEHATDIAGAFSDLREQLIEERGLDSYLADKVAIKLLRLFPAASWGKVWSLYKAKQDKTKRSITST